MTSKVKFKFILTTDPKLPYKVMSFAENTPFSACLRYAAEEFKVPPVNAVLVDGDGVRINLQQTAANIFLKHGSDLRLVRREIQKRVKAPAAVATAAAP